MNLKPALNQTALIALLLVMGLAFGTAAEAQVVKTYTTGDLFKKRREKKEKEEQEKQAALDAEVKKNADVCTGFSDQAIEWANTFNRASSSLGLLFNSNNDFYAPNIGKFEKELSQLDGLFPDTKVLTEEASKLTAACQDCRDRGFTHLNESGYNILAGVANTLDSKFGNVMPKLEANNQRTRKYLSLDQSSIFVNQESGPINPDKAKVQYDLFNRLLPSFKMLMEMDPGLQNKYGTQLAELEKSYGEVGSKLGDIRDAFFVSPYHKENDKHLAFAKAPIQPGSEASSVNPVFKPGDPIAFAMYTHESFREITSYTSGKLNFYIGDQFVASLPVWPMGKDGERDGGFTTRQVIWTTAEKNLEGGENRSTAIEKWLRTCGKLTPVKHTMKVVYSPEYSTSRMATGTLTLDCTGMNANGPNAFVKLADAIDKTRQEQFEDKFLDGYEFKNEYNSSAMRASVQRMLVEAGKGKVKRAKVYFTDHLWTVVTNEFGVHKYRYLPFEYLLEDQAGNVYVGNSSISEDPLTNGSFDTQSRELDDFILTNYGDGDLEDGSGGLHPNYGKQWKVTRSKVEKYL